MLSTNTCLLTVYIERVSVRLPGTLSTRLGTLEMPVEGEEALVVEGEVVVVEAEEAVVT